MRVCEIRVIQIRVNQGLGVQFKHKMQLSIHLTSDVLHMHRIIENSPKTYNEK